MVAKANQKLGMLRRTFISDDAEMWKKLYISMVRTNLGYASSVWNPYNNMRKGLKNLISQHSRRDEKEVT
jgi:hypothetical protein